MPPAASAAASPLPGRQPLPQPERAAERHHRRQGRQHQPALQRRGQPQAGQQPGIVERRAEQRLQGQVAQRRGAGAAAPARPAAAPAATAPGRPGRSAGSDQRDRQRLGQQLGDRDIGADQRHGEGQLRIGEQQGAASSAAEPCAASRSGALSRLRRPPPALLSAPQREPVRGQPLAGSTVPCSDAICWRGRRCRAARAPARPAPRSARPPARVLRFVPQTDLTVLDPVFTTAYITRHHAMMIYDQLYGLDAKLQPQPQMVEGHEVEADGLTWRFRLREGLLFHDGEPVRGRDCIASIRRWAQRDALGQALMARVARDDGAGRPQLPHPADQALRPDAGDPGQARPLARSSSCRSASPRRTPIPRSARPSAAAPSASWPMSAWSAPAWSSSATRPTGRARAATTSWAAGPKLVHFDRVEWTVMPDPGTSAAALRNGEVDWWENPPNDLAPVLRRDARHRRSSAAARSAPSAPASSTACTRPSTSRRAPRRAARHEPGGFHDRRGGHRPLACGAPMPASSPRARRWRTMPGWRPSPARATSSARSAS